VTTLRKLKRPIMLISSLVSVFCYCLERRIDWLTDYGVFGEGVNFWPTLYLYVIDVVSLGQSSDCAVLRRDALKQPLHCKFSFGLRKISLIQPIKYRHASL